MIIPYLEFHQNVAKSGSISVSLQLLDELNQLVEEGNGAIRLQRGRKRGGISSSCSQRQEQQFREKPNPPM